jgi:hypothetical protein
LVFVVKGKVPGVLRDRLRLEAGGLGVTDSALLRTLVFTRIRGLDMAREVERDPGNQWVKCKMTEQQFQLFDLKAKALGCSRADLLMTVMLEEWA